MNTDQIIELLPDVLQARLQAAEFFEDIPVVTYRAGNVASEIARKQAAMTEAGRKRGVAVVVLEPIADDFARNLRFGPMSLMPAFQVVENVELNNDARGTGKSWRRVARRIVLELKGFGVTGMMTVLEADSPCIEPVQFAEELGKHVRGGQVNFKCLEQSDEVHSQVERPVFAVAEDGESWSISCATDGATIYYTTDLSYPGPDNDGAQVVSEGAVAITGAVTVWACAHKSGLVSSWVSCLKIE